MMRAMRKTRGVAGLVLSLCLCSLAAHSQQQPVPQTLFGVPLGGIFTAGTTERPTDVGTLPIKEQKAVETFMGSGFSLYFKPTKEYEAFKYLEQKDKPEDKFSKTTFRMYLFPVFPKDAPSRKNLSEADLKYEVALIEWSDKQDNKDEAYYWAYDLCKTLQADLGRKAEVLNHFDSKWHKCKLVEGDKELTAENLGELKIFRLAYTDEVFKKKDAAVDTIQRKLRMNRTRPY
jgi:hypothetical protein